jgi:DNA-binding NtrC family response regulator
MLVDDEASIVRVYAGKLERLGYRVEGFSDPSEALERFRAAPDVFDLVLTDLSMPGLDGDRLLREILGIQEDIPVILYTGYPDRMNEEKAQSLGASGCLEKPLDFDTLCRSLRRAFEKRSR